MPILSTEIITAINAEIAREQTASNTYRAMAMWAKGQGYFGTEHWAAEASNEEIQHRDKFQSYLVDLGATATTPTGDAVPVAWADLPGAFDAALALEKTVTAAIQGIYGQAMAEGDFLTAIFLHWFIAEQATGMAQIMDVQKLFRTFGMQGASLALVDEAIGKL
jgi:ferritin